jgi:hypothetical protein
MIDHADCQWKQVGLCVYCADHGVRLFMGDLPERKRTIPVCAPDAHDWDDETGQGVYGHCRTCGLNEWYE